jgi:uncharacterized protein YkwD
MGQLLISKILLGIAALFSFTHGLFFQEEARPAPMPTLAATTTQVRIASTTIADQRNTTATPAITKKSQLVSTELAPTPKTVSTPGPLVRATTSSVVQTSALTREAIIAATNVERVRAGLPSFVQNATLSAEAEAKALDMISKQYFAHVAPDGTDLGALAKKYGYDYLNVGENLALGDFRSSLDVVTGWMNSPGHRANILHKEFTEIGVAAVEGNWKGEQVWFAVQEFGRPASACPSPDHLLKEKIVAGESTLASLDKTLTMLKEAIASGAGDQALMIAQTNEYNAIVHSYNSFIVTTKADIAAYNAEVQAFNTCAGL